MPPSSKRTGVQIAILPSCSLFQEKKKKIQARPLFFLNEGGWGEQKDLLFPALITHLSPHPTRGHCRGEIWEYFLAPETPVWGIMGSKIPLIYSESSLSFPQRFSAKPSAPPRPVFGP